LPEMGVNLFNMGFDTSLNELKEVTENQVVMVGNIPPRDVLAEGSPEDVRKAVKGLLDTLDDKSRIILSCGGGLTLGITSENIQAFIEAVRDY